VTRPRKNTKVCTQCGGLCDQCRERLLEKVREIAGIMVSEAVRISTGHTGNQWLTIPDPPPKRDDHK
jgi:hypothetical protein